MDKLKNLTFTYKDTENRSEERNRKRETVIWSQAEKTLYVKNTLSAIILIITAKNDMDVTAIELTPKLIILLGV